MRPSVTKGTNVLGNEERVGAGGRRAHGIGADALAASRRASAPRAFATRTFSFAALRPQPMRHESQAAQLAGQDPCPTGEDCITGCCVAIPN